MCFDYCWHVFLQHPQVQVAHLPTVPTGSSEKGTAESPGPPGASIAPVEQDSTSCLRMVQQRMSDELRLGKENLPDEDVYQSVPLLPLPAV